MLNLAALVIPLALGGVLMVLAVVALKRRRAKKLVETFGREHDCLPGSFIPQLRTKAIKIGRNGGKEHGLVVFCGLFCSQCGKELFCSACGGTPDMGSVIGSEEERYRILRCCESPDYQVRDSGPDRDALDDVPASTQTTPFPLMN